MEKLKQYKYIILVILIILGVAFSWFEYRPQRAIKYCYGFASVSKTQAEFDRVFKQCLLEKGFK